MTLDLIKAVALLLALSLLQGLNARLLHGNQTLEKTVSGVLFGCICVIGMMMPIEVIPGVIFDARSVVLSMAGLFGGPVVGVISATIAGGGRLWIGGAGAPVGVAVVVSSVSLGLAYWYCRKRGWVGVGFLQLLVFGFLVHLVEIVLFTQLPGEIVQTVMENVALPLLASFTLATAILGLILHDLELRLETERSLKRSQQRLSHHIQNTPLGAISWDEKCYCTEWNKAAEKIFGYTSEEALGKDGISLIVPDSIKDEMWQGFDLLMEQKGGFRSTHENITKDGRTIMCDWYNTPITDEDGKVIGVTSLVHDITKRTQTESQLLQAGKLASLGEMATGIAHELNQPLHIIRMLVDTLEEKASEQKILDQEDLKDKLRRVSSQTERAANIIDHMRVFGRIASEEKEHVSLPDVVINASGFIQEKLRLHGVELELDWPENCRPVLGHAIRLEQVILNLLSNASDAIDRKNNASGNGQGEDHIVIRIEDDHSTDKLKLVVGDSGGGISENNLDRIFDPFFTTKEVGKGTGIGLSISYGIISDMGGKITAVNKNGGAEFIVSLPAV